MRLVVVTRARTLRTLWTSYVDTVVMRERVGRRVVDPCLFVRELVRVIALLFHPCNGRWVSEKWSA